MAQPAAAPLQRAFVTGGSGFVGRNLVRRLRADGVTVAALARSDAARRTVEDAGAVAVTGDIHSEAAMARGMAGADVVFHLAWAGLDMRGPILGLRRNNVDGLKATARAASAAGVHRLVFVSTEAVLFGKPIEDADETEPYPDPAQSAFGSQNPYSVTKREAEAWLLGPEPRALNLGIVILRPRLVWGRDDTTVTPQLAAMARAGMLALLGGAGARTSSCHVDNVAEALILAATRGSPGEIYHCTDGPSAPAASFYDALTEAASGRPPALRAGLLPPGAASAFAFLGAVVEGLTLGLVPAPLSFADVLAFGRTVTVSDAKARQQLGYAPRVSRREGLAGVAAARGDHEAAHAAQLADAWADERGKKGAEQKQA